MNKILKPFFESPPSIKTDLVSAKAVVFARKKKVLLLQKPSGEWDLPGGKLEAGENWLEGLAREVYEESGFEIDQADWVAGWMDVNCKAETVLRGIFFCEIDRKPKKSRIALSGEHVMGDFFSLKKIEELRMREEYMRAINWAAEKVGA